MKHNIIHFYASNNFDKNELDAIREAKKKAISEKYISSYIEEIGTGSSNKRMTLVRETELYRRYKTV